MRYKVVALALVLMGCASVPSVLTSALADDKGWTVAVDNAASPKRVVEEAYGTPDFTHRSSTGFKVGTGVPSSLVETVPMKYQTWNDTDADGTVQGSEIVEMTAGQKTTADANDATATTSTIRASAKTKLDAHEIDPVLLRAVADITKDEINLLREWIENFKTQVALSVSLADLKARIALLPSLPDRTLDQLKTAIKTRIDTGSLD